jgi:ferrous iron transport protein B
MATATGEKAITVALVGNPNTGKSTLFNALSGLNQRVGNYPGVTVEKKTGVCRQGDRELHLVDLPGTYSLSPKSPDEAVALRVLLGRQPDVPEPDVVVCVTDASNLERNLFLVSQVTDLGVAVIVALNKGDIARRHGVNVDPELLARRLEVPVVEIQANRRLGIDALKQKIVDVVEQGLVAEGHHFPPQVEEELKFLCKRIDPVGCNPRTRFLAQRLLLDGSGIVSQVIGPHASISEAVNQSRDRLTSAGLQLSAIESVSRYTNIGKLTEKAIDRPKVRGVSTSDRIDRVLTHKVWGTLVFVVVMILAFQMIFVWSGPATDWIESAVSWIGSQVGEWLPEGAIRSMIVEGAIAGVGAVVVFLPQILFLFFLLALLEDCGYMARAAYLMDKVMCKVGLSGKSFIPLLSSFGCAIPGIMATRVIESPRDRLLTMLVAPLMSCSARLPVYVLLIAAFVPSTSVLGGVIGLQPMVMFAMYVIGVIVAMAVAWVLKRTLLRGETPAFVMELPDYKLPSLRNAMRRMLEQAWAFVRRAGTLIFAVTIIVWALVWFPHPPEVEQQVRERLTASGEYTDNGELEEAISRESVAAYMRQSWLARIGRLFEPVVNPLGWDWKVASAVMASFPAREVVVGTLGVLFNAEGEIDEASEPLRERLQSATWDGTDRKLFNLPMALGLMVFFALCAQCVSTLAVMARESGGWFWPAFTFVYMTALAWIGAFVTYRAGMFISGGGS